MANISYTKLYVNNVKNVSLGGSVFLPDYIKNNHGLRNTSNLCFFAVRLLIERPNRKSVRRLPKIYFVSIANIAINLMSRLNIAGV